MSQSDNDRPTPEVSRVQQQPVGGQTGSSQSRPASQPAGGSSHEVTAGAQAIALEHPHPSPATYIRIAVVLGAITAVEVLVYYVEALRPMLVPILLALSALKFSLVVAFYMHLRFDSKLFRNLFVFGLAVAASIMIALLLINSYHAPVPTAGVA